MASGEEAWSSKAEVRITPLGRILRKTSLDEIPQFYNVLKGDMSVVGPRPERPKYVEQFSTQIPKYRLKHRVRPGITGLAQINGFRGDTSVDQRIKYDLYYIENWSFTMDLFVILKTILFGFLSKSES
jgi:lipopolysaccharide/colanic/teichoic acid biosynthesis glycosyltransferase